MWAGKVDQLSGKPRGEKMVNELGIFSGYGKKRCVRIYYSYYYRYESRLTDTGLGVTEKERAGSLEGWCL